MNCAAIESWDGILSDGSDVFETKRMHGRDYSNPPLLEDIWKIQLENEFGNGVKPAHRYKNYKMFIFSFVFHNLNVVDGETHIEAMFAFRN